MFIFLICVAVKMKHTLTAVLTESLSLLTQFDISLILFLVALSHSSFLLVSPNFLLSSTMEI